MSNRFKWIQMGYLRISPFFRHAHTHIWNGVELFAESLRAKRCQGASWFSQCQRRFRAVCVASMLGCSRILLGHVAHHAGSA